MQASWFVACVLALLCGVTLAQEQEETTSRTYDQGPLRREEFLGKPDRSSNGKAYTATRIEFKYEYIVARRGSIYEAKLKSFSVVSKFLPESSWWKGGANADLLDHEQGHFDIAQEMALRLRLQYQRAVKKGSVPSAKAATSAKAIRALANRLEKIMESANKQVKASDEEYDSSTSHGTRFGTQAEFRRVQSATLERLVKELGEDPRIIPRKRNEKSRSR